MFIFEPDLSCVELEEEESVVVDGLEGEGDRMDNASQVGERETSLFFKGAGESITGEGRREQEDAIFAQIGCKGLVDAGFGEVREVLVADAVAGDGEFFDDVGCGMFFAFAGGFPDDAVGRARDIALEDVGVFAGVDTRLGCGGLKGGLFGFL